MRGDLWLGQRDMLHSEGGLWIWSLGFSNPNGGRWCTVDLCSIKKSQDNSGLFHGINSRSQIWGKGGPGRRQDYWMENAELSWFLSRIWGPSCKSPSALQTELPLGFSLITEGSRHDQAFSYTARAAGLLKTRNIAIIPSSDGTKMVTQTCLWFGAPDPPDRPQCPNIALALPWLWNMWMM